MKEVLAKAEEKMKKTVAVLEKELSEIRAGRANPAVLDKIKVDYYGAPTAINQLAAVSVTEARVLVIQPWDKSVTRMIEHAIQKSDLGVNPQSDGSTIRLIFPPLNEERRRLLVKDIAKMCEESKVAVRSIRRDAVEQVKKLKKNSEITEDDQKRAEEAIQKLTDANIKDIDKITAEKEKEIMDVK